MSYDEVMGAMRAALRGLGVEVVPGSAVETGRSWTFTAPQADNVDRMTYTEVTMTFPDGAILTARVPVVRAERQSSRAIIERIVTYLEEGLDQERGG